ncbi:OLC1v1003093C1 [Oldenlandia corymbosa var. corymbosa]|uniref:Proteasome assembly chaperone 2 n=1 Tax=Oldenlandia corymbosa var. corymbosa TaxID=529605 RepID=A0AAV1D993_OLDCO|nr:OLC1v1003093C1 [Oldenlandia corymbosa var. corymbosa]
MEFFPQEEKKLEESCSTLVLPALSVGNVGQLAVDLLISSLRAERIGYLDDPNVLPGVGNNAYSPSPPGDLTLPLEVYCSKPHGLALIQQRSPVIKGSMIDFAKNLAKFAAANQKKHVIILSSLDFMQWKNIDMSSGLQQIYYLSSSNIDGTDDDCEKRGMKRLPEYNPSNWRWEYLHSIGEKNPAEDHDFPFEDLGEEDYYPSLPFAALFSCFKAQGIKATCIFCYCSEGDNTPHAFSVAGAASRILNLGLEDVQGETNSRWIVPFSWKSVYGPPADAALF